MHLHTKVYKKSPKLSFDRQWPVKLLQGYKGHQAVAEFSIKKPGGEVKTHKVTGVVSAVHLDAKNDCVIVEFGASCRDAMPVVADLYPFGTPNEPGTPPFGNHVPTRIAFSRYPVAT